MDEIEIKNDKANAESPAENSVANTAAQAQADAVVGVGADGAAIADAAVAAQEETYKEMSPLRLVLRRFFRSKLSINGLVMIIFLFVFSFLGPVIYRQWGEGEVDETPTLTVVTQTFTYRDENGEIVTVYEQLVHESPYNEYASPSKDHLLGTDDKGMDVFVRDRKSVV